MKYALDTELVSIFTMRILLMSRESQTVLDSMICILFVVLKMKCVYATSESF